MNQPTSDSGNQPSAQREDDDQVAASRFQCPACRARQSLQNECRRCSADLSLLVAAHHRITFLQKQLGQTPDGSPAHKRLTTELQMFVGTASTKNTDRQ